MEQPFVLNPDLPPIHPEALQEMQKWITDWRTREGNPIKNGDHFEGYGHPLCGWAFFRNSPGQKANLFTYGHAGCYGGITGQIEEFAKKYKEVELYCVVPYCAGQSEPKPWMNKTRLGTAKSKAWLEYILGPLSPWQILLPFLVSRDPEEINNNGGFIFRDLANIPLRLFYSFIVTSRKPWENYDQHDTWMHYTAQGIDPRHAALMAEQWTPEAQGSTQYKYQTSTRHGSWNSFTILAYAARYFYHQPDLIREYSANKKRTEQGVCPNSYIFLSSVLNATKNYYSEIVMPKVENPKGKDKPWELPDILKYLDTLIEEQTAILGLEVSRGQQVAC